MSTTKEYRLDFGEAQSSLRRALNLNVPPVNELNVSVILLLSLSLTSSCLTCVFLLIICLTLWTYTQKGIKTFF